MGGGCKIEKSKKMVVKLYAMGMKWKNLLFWSFNGSSRVKYTTCRFNIFHRLKYKYALMLYYEAGGK